MSVAVLKVFSIYSELNRLFVCLFVCLLDVVWYNQFCMIYSKQFNSINTQVCWISKVNITKSDITNYPVITKSILFRM